MMEGTTALNNGSILATTLFTTISSTSSTSRITRAPTIRTPSTSTVTTTTTTTTTTTELGITSRKTTTEISHLNDTTIVEQIATAAIDNLVNTTTQSILDGLKSTINTPIKNATTKSSGCVPLGRTTTTTTTEEPFDDFGPPEGIEYIFVPVGVMIFVVILSIAMLIISRKRKLERLRHRLMPLYNFDPGEEGEDDWETELLDEGIGNRNPRKQGYQSMDSEENAELFGR